MGAPLYGYQVYIDVRYRPDGNWELLRRLRYLSALTQKAYTIERGFVFNGASVPPFSIVGVADRHSAFPGTVVHDYLADNPDIEPPDVADEIFKEIMAGQFHAGNIYEGAVEPAWRQQIMGWAVRFGAHHFVGRDGERTGFLVRPQTADG